MLKFILTLLSYLLAIAAGVFAVFFPPVSLSLGPAVTTWLGILLLAGGLLGLISHIWRLVYLEAMAIIPIVFGILAYAASAGIVAIAATPSRGLQVTILLFAMVLIIRYGLSLLNQAKVQVDNDR